MTLDPGWGATADTGRAVQQLDGRLRDLLAGKKIVMTGVTGFIGEQLLWKILTELPETRPAVLVRRKGSASARDRMIAVVKKPIFDDLRNAAGGAVELLDAGIDVIEGDLPNVPQLPADLDIVVHCAGDVSFDPPIDQAFMTNVIGTKALLDRMLHAVTDEAGQLRRVPHYVHISTAYTAGRRRGAIPEAPHEHDIDYEAETAAGIAMRDLIESESRTSLQLAKLRQEAEREHRQAGFLTTAADTERRRLAWVQAELVKAGTERARSLGWTDAYTFTKALGERVVADVGQDVHVSIVRPAIVESSWLHPYPGWIEGFKMAEPLILAYGRGELPEFPATPEAIVDIVPCDHVVNAILAVCATQPEPGEPEYYHVNSGARNPMTFKDLYTYIRTYFLAHPFEGGPRGAARLPQWTFPGASSIERLLSTSERAHKLAERMLAQMPRSDRTRKIAKDLDRTRVRLDFVRRYHTLYKEYAQSELHFVDDNTLALTRALHPDDQACLCLRHFGLRLEDLHPGSALSIHHCAAAPDGLSPQQARQSPDHDEGPGERHGWRCRPGDLRPGRHDHVHQRDRAIPLGSPAGAVTHPSACRSRPGHAAPSVVPACRATRPWRLLAGGVPPLSGR